jgi:hypothetical protein
MSSVTLGAHAGAYKYRVGICSKADDFGALAGSGDHDVLIRIKSPRDWSRSIREDSGSRQLASRLALLLHIHS